VPDILQPLIVAAAGAVPFIEGEGSTIIGVIGGLHPLLAGAAAAIGNFTCVLLVVLLSSHIRSAALEVKQRRAAVPALASVGEANPVTSRGTRVTGTLVDDPLESNTAESKGRQKARRWLVRFGVPGASVLGPLAIPTQFTAAMFVASGVPRGRVILWQGIAIALWTSLVTAVAMGFMVAIEV
jgi:hypothetical protein